MANKKTFILSDESLNNKDFVVETAGIDLSGFKKNPVMLFNHDTDKLIGKWANVKKDGDKLIAEPEFDMDDEFAAKQSKRVDDGFLNATSIWIHPLKFTLSEDNEPPRVTKCILMEASMVPVPANHGAVRLCNENGEQLSGDALKEVIIKLSASDDDPTPTTKIKSKSDMKEFKLSAENVVKLGLKEGFQETEMNTAIEKLAADKAAAETKATNAESELKALKDTRKKNMLDEALAAGKFKADERKDWEDLADANVELCAKNLEKIPAAKKPSEMIQLGGNGAAAAAGDDKNPANWDYKTWSQKDPNGLALMAKVEKERFEQLKADHIKGYRG